MGTHWSNLPRRCTTCQLQAAGIAREADSLVVSLSVASEEDLLGRHVVPGYRVGCTEV